MVKYSWTFFKIIVFFSFGLPSLVFSQPGSIVETGDIVLDPDQDGFISESNTGFLGDGYDVDEFEIKMFGVPIFGDGEALADNANGPACGVSDLALDTAGFAIYAGYDDNKNLIFRMRLAGDNSSVQSYTIFIDSDQAIGPEDLNANSENPGFEIEITLIQNFGVYIYDIDGIDSCPNPLRQYDVDTHQQKSISSQESCNDEDYFLDFYVPFPDLEDLFGIDENTLLRFVGVTNISATCALDGSISDIGGVDDSDYDGCFTCAMLDLSENQCPSGISNLCETCAGFPLGVTETPDINTPVLVGDQSINGTAEPNAFIYIDFFSSDDILFDQDSIESDENGIWVSSDLNRALDFGDSIVVNALLPGRCQSGLNDAGLSFAIVSPNQPPQLFGTQTTITYIENNPPVEISDDIDIIDDNDDLEGASVSISSNYNQGFDFLQSVPTGGISQEFDPDAGVLSFTGTAPILDYINTLRTVKFENTSDNPSLDIRIITITVSDGVNTSAAFNRNLIITPVNDPPSIIDLNDSIFVSTDEDVPLEICIDVVDIDSEEFQFGSITLKNGSGLLELSEPLCILYTPEPDFNGNEYITVEICDVESNSLCDLTVIAIDVIPVNDPPVVVDPGPDPPDTEIEIDSTGFRIEKNTPLSFCLEGFDIDGDNLDVTDISFDSPTNSTLNHTGNLCFDFIPENGLIGFQTASITICDDGDPQACIIILVTFEIIAVNTAPFIEVDTVFVETLKNIPLTICIPSQDPDGDPLTVASVDNALGSTENTGIDLCFDYTPEANFTGDEYFDVTVCDNINPSLCDMAVIALTVIPTNNPPVVIEDSNPVDTVYFETTINTLLDFCLEVLDPDNDDVSLTTITVEGPSGSTVVQVSDLCGQFDPGNDFVGQEWITVELCDTGNPQACINAVIEIEVFPVNRPPVILENEIEVDTLNFVIDQDNPFAFCLDVLDFENDNIEISEIVTVEQGGFYQPTEEELCIEFIPEPGFTGNDIHIVTVCDSGVPQGCDVVVIEIEILPVNHPPVIHSGGVSVDTLRFTVSANNLLEICIDAMDEDNDQLALNPESILPESGQAELSGADDLCISYSPPTNYLGFDYLKPSVCDDGSPEACDMVVIEIEIVADNNPPGILLNGVEVDTLIYSTFPNIPVQICLEALDPDDDLVLIEEFSIPVNGEVSDVQDNLCLTYIPAQDFLGNDWFTTRVCDDRFPFLCDEVVIGINVNSNNTAPRILFDNNSIDSLLIDALENQMVSLTLLLADDENDELIISSEALVAGSGQLSSVLNENISIEYIPDLGSAGLHRINLEVCDNGIPVLCDSISIGLNVSAVNLAPIAVNDTFELVGNSLIANILANDSDPDEDSIYIDIASLILPEAELVELSQTGDLIFEPIADFDGIVEFEYTVCDVRTDQLCSTALVLIDIPPRERVIIAFEAVSPNGDDLNDFWTIQDITYFPRNKVRIFDRWNNLVYEVSGYNNDGISWRGQSNRGVSRKDLPDGTYYFVIDPGNDSPAISGMVVLKR